MDVGGATGFDSALMISRHEMLETLTRDFGKIEALSGQGAAPASRVALPDGWTFGIVSSTTRPFCASCDRSRLTADGVWYRCLYAHSGTDLRTPLRGAASGEELRQILVSAWRVRRDQGAVDRLTLSTRTAVPVALLRRDPYLEMHTRGG